MGGEKNGKGKEYYKNGTLKFEGEYSDNEPMKGNRYGQNLNIINLNGKVKEYNCFGDLEFEGYYLNG